MIFFGRQMKISVVIQVIQPLLRNFPKFENFRIFNEQWFKMSNFNSIKPFEKASEPSPDFLFIFTQFSRLYIQQKIFFRSLLINHPTASKTKFYKNFREFLQKKFFEIFLQNFDF